MRASVTSLTKKLISTFFAATLVMGLVPAAAFAANEDTGALAPENSESADANRINTASEESDANKTLDPSASSDDPSVISSEVEKSALIEQSEGEALTSSRGEGEATDNVMGSDDSAITIPAATERINEDVMLTTPVAQQETTKNYFLAQTLESTRTVPIVTAQLPLDKGPIDVEVVEPDIEGEGSDTTEDEGGDDSDDPDDAADSTTTDNPVDASFTLASSESDSAVSAESTVIGSFTYLGMTYAIEPGGETVALVAVDYNKLPETFIEKQIIAIPESVTPDGIDYYSVTRIADNAFTSLTKDKANEDYKGCIALFSDEELLAEAGIDAAEVESFLNPESDMIDIDGEMDAPANPLKDCVGILAVGIPASVTSIEDDAVASSDTLQYLVVSEDNSTYASYDGALYSADLTNLRLIPEGRVGAVRVAPSATDVSPEAFSHCPSVTTLVADPESEAWQELQTCELRNGSAELIKVLNTIEANARFNLKLSALEKAAVKLLIGLAEGEVLSVVHDSVSNKQDMSGILMEERSISYAMKRVVPITDVELTLSAESYLDGKKRLFVAGRITKGYAREMTYTDADGHTVDVLGLTVNGFEYYKKGTTTRIGVTTQRDMDWSTVKPFFPWVANDAVSAFLCNGCGAEISDDYLQKLSDNAEDTGTMRFLPGCLDTWEVDDNGYGKVSNYNVTDCAYTAIADQVCGYLDAHEGLFANQTPFWTLSADLGGKWKDVPKDPTRRGYTFKEYTNAAGVKFEKDAVLNENNAHKYYARWNPKKSDLTFSLGATNATGEVPSPGVLKATYDSTMPTYTKDVPQRPGYTFTGFYDAPTNGFRWYNADLTPSDRIWIKDTTDGTTLYAQWQKNPVYTITLDAQGGTGGDTKIYEWYGRGFYSESNPTGTSEAMTSITAPTKPGYTFKGYNTSLAATNGSYWTTLNTANNAATPMPSATAFSADTKLYAKYKANVYTITLDWNTSSTLPTNNVWPLTKVLYVKYGVGWFSDAACTTSVNYIGYTDLSGYTYGGFADSDDATIGQYWTTLHEYAYNSATPMPSITAFTSDTTLYAVWHGVSCKVVFSANGGSGGQSEDIFATCGSPLPEISKEKPTLAGYIFMGWYDNYIYTRGTQYYDENCVPVRNWDKASTGSVQLSAGWKQAEYTIKFDANGGSGGQEADVIATYKNVLPKITSTKPKREGYTFDGWYDTSASSGGTMYYKADGTSNKDWDKTSGATLYARWSGETSRVYFVDGGGSGGPTSYVTATYGDSMPPISSTPTYEGYAFAGYCDINPDTGGARTQYYTESGASARDWDKPSGTYTLMAKWIPNKYTVRYYNRAGDVKISEDDGFVVGTTRHLASKPTTNLTPGYTPQGWATSAGQTTKVYDFNAGATSLTKAANGIVELFLAESPNSYTIVYDGNGNTGGSTASTPATYDSDVTLAANGFERTGFTFSKWNTQADGKGDSYDPGAKLTKPNFVMSGSKTLYAIWDTVGYTITARLLGGNIDGVWDDWVRSYTVDSDDIKLPTPTREGYSFVGWTGSNGTTPQKDVTVVKGSTGDKIYDAKWTAVKYTITADPKGGKIDGKTDKWTTTYYCNAAFQDITLPTPSRDGYSFEGWTGSNGTTPQKSVTVTKGTGDKTYEANWTTIGYTITAKPNGGKIDGKTDDWTRSYNIESKDILLPTPSWDGYNFDGWTGANGNTAQKTVTVPQGSFGNKTYVANWSATRYVITADPKGGKIDGKTEKWTKDYDVTSEATTLPTPERDGYDFDGWTGSNGATAQKPMIVAKGSIGDKLYEANWTLHTYKITYDLDGGVNSADNPSTYTYTSNAITLKEPSKTGYDFAGWTGSNGTTASKSVTIAKNSTGDKNYKANWTRKTYVAISLKNDKDSNKVMDTVYYWPDKGIVTGVSSEVFASKTDPTYVVSSASGYTFLGYYSESTKMVDAEGHLTDEGLKAKPASNTEWISKWDANKYAVSFHGNGGTGGQSDTVEVTFDADMPDISREKPKYPGYIFNGWWDSPGRSGGNMYYDASCDSAATWDKPNDATLYARWSAKDTFTVNLVDMRLSSGDKTLIYWPERGIVKSTTDDTAAQKGEKVTEPARVADYEFLGWYDAPEGTAGAKKMVDSDGKLAEDVTGEYLKGTVIWHAWWKHVSCPVNLAASYGTPAFEVVSKGRELIEHAAFDEPFKNSLSGGTIETPKRTGYTFMGYFSEQNPEWGTDKAVDDYNGFRWIDGQGKLTEDNWTMRPSVDKGSITLYAAWQLVDCVVTFDLDRRNGAEPVVGTVGNAIWHYGKTVTGPLPVSNNYTFQRNGYDFDGWYYYDKNGDEVRLGAKNGDVTDALEPWLDDRKAVTLYAYWIPRTYVLEFDERYPVVEGAAPEAENEHETMEVKYDQTIDLPKPTYGYYRFNGWYTESEVAFEGKHMTDGRFTPRGAMALYTKDKGNIELHAHWLEPGEASYTLYVGTPGGTELVSETPRTYKYTSTVVLGPSLAPERVEGWSFAGWVKVDDDAQARSVIANGGPAADAKTESGFGPLVLEDMFFVAKWKPLEYELRLASTPADDDLEWLLSTDRLIDHKVEGIALWSEVCDDLGIMRPDLTRSLIYGSSQRAYALPEVLRKGYLFEGWVRQGSMNATPSKDVKVDPKDQAAVAQDATLVYVPVFSKTKYTVVLDPNGYGLEEKTYEVRFGDKFDFPYPTALNTGACFDLWTSDATAGDNADHTFLQGSSWPVAPVYDEDGNVVEFGLAQLADENNEIRLYAIWSPAYSVDVPLFANMAIDIETGDVAAATNKLTPWNTDETAVYRVESLRYEPMFDDEDRPAFQGADGAYLSVYAGLSLENEKDAPYLLHSDNVGFKGEVEYTDIEGKTRTAKPLLIRLGGTTPRLYTRTASKADGTIAEEAADETYGFGTFTAKNPLTLRYGLYFADGVSVASYAFGKNPGGWELPENDHGNASTSDDARNEDYKRGLGWSSNRVDIARLTYTVSMSQVPVSE